MRPIENPLMISCCIQPLDEEIPSLRKDLDEVVDQLKAINGLSKKQKLKLMDNDPEFLTNCLKLLRLERNAQFIDQDSASLSEMAEECKKLLLRIEFSRSGTAINLCERDNGLDDSLIIIVSGIVQVHSFSEQLFKRTIRDSAQNNQLMVKKKQKQEVRVSYLDTDHIAMPPLIDEMFVTRVLTASTVDFFRIPKRAYQSFVLWLHNKQIELNIEFLIKSLYLEVNDIRSYRLHRKPFLHFSQGKTVDVNRKGYGLLILRKGEVKVTYSLESSENQRNEDDNPRFRKDLPKEFKFLSKQQRKQTYVILTEGSIINCSGCHFLESHSRTIKSVLVIKQCAILNIDAESLNELFEYIPRFQISLAQQFDEIISKRMDHTLKHSPQPLKTDYNEELRAMHFGTYKEFKTCKNVRRRFNSRQIRKDVNDQSERFISNFPYAKLILSKEIVSKTKSEKPETSESNRYKTNVKKAHSKKKEYTERLLKLKLRSLAQKSMSNTNRQSIDAAIGNGQHQLRRGLFDEAEFLDESDEDPAKDMSRVTLASNDMGIIRGIAKDSKNFQKEMNHLLKQSQERSNMLSLNQRKRTKLKRNFRDPNSLFSKNRNTCDFDSRQNRLNQALKRLELYTHINLTKRDWNQGTERNGNVNRKNGKNAHRSQQDLTKRESLTSDIVQRNPKKIFHLLKNGKMRRFKFINGLRNQDKQNRLSEDVREEHIQAEPIRYDIRSPNVYSRFRK